MGGLRIEVITWPVKVCRQQENCVEAKFCTIRLGLNQHHLFRQSIRSIRLFRVTIPEIVLFKGHWSEFRICTNGPDGNELFYPAPTGFFHHLCTHHQIVVEKLSGVFLIMANATNYSR